jgi:hypothetical protein
VETLTYLCRTVVVQEFHVWATPGTILKLLHQFNGLPAEPLRYFDKIIMLFKMIREPGTNALAAFAFLFVNLRYLGLSGEVIFEWQDGFTTISGRGENVMQTILSREDVLQYVHRLRQ